jgi:hypothetical protein
MGRMYTVSVTESAQTTQIDLVEIVPAAGRVVVIHGWEIGQSTELGDAAEESITLLAKRGSSASTSGTGGAVTTPTPTETNAGAATSTVETMNTTAAVAGGGTLVTLMATAFNIRSSPIPWTFTPEMRFVIGPAERFVLGLNDAPTDSITFSLTLWFEEIG